MMNRGVRRGAMWSGALGITGVLATTVGLGAVTAMPSGAAGKVHLVPSITTTALPSGSVGVPYEAVLQATNLSAPFHWVISTGNLPTGLHLSAKTGEIAGIPRRSGNQSISFTIRSVGRQSSTTLSISIGAAPAPTVTSTTLPGASVGTPYLAQLSATGGTAPYRWKIVSGQLPTGLFLDGRSGQIAGDPRSIGTSTFTVGTIDVWGAETTAVLSIGVSPATLPSITTTTLPDAVVGVNYAESLGVSGGVGLDHFRIVAGQLPTGLHFDGATGQITGDPKDPASDTFTVEVIDGVGGTATATLTLVVVS